MLQQTFTLFYYSIYHIAAPPSHICNKNSARKWVGHMLRHVWCKQYCLSNAHSANHQLLAASSDSNVHGIM